MRYRHSHTDLSLNDMTCFTSFAIFDNIFIIHFFVLGMQVLRQIFLTVDEIISGFTIFVCDVLFFILAAGLVFRLSMVLGNYVRVYTIMGFGAGVFAYIVTI